MVIGVVELIQHACRRVDHQRVAVPGGHRAALDRRACAERVGTPIALICVVEVDPGEPRMGASDLPRNPVGTRPAARTVVGVQVGRTGRHVLEPCRRVGIDGKAGDRRVPHVIGRERRTLGAGEQGAGGPRCPRLSPRLPARRPGCPRSQRDHRRRHREEEGQHPDGPTEPATTMNHDAGAIDVLHVSSSASRMLLPASNSSVRDPPRDLARYIAVSARWSSRSG